MHASEARHLLPLGAVCAALTAAAPAAAQTPPPTPPPAPPAAAPPAPAPSVAPPAAGHVRVGFKAPYRDKGHRVGLKGDAVLVRGRLTPAAPDQRAVVRLSHGARTLKTRHVRLRPDGTFSVRMRLRATGTLAVRALHQDSPQVRRARSAAARVVVFSPKLHRGSRGALTRVFKRGLARMKYPVGAKGSYDATTGRAVLAYRKVNRLARTETASAAVIRRVLHGKGAYRVRHPGLGHHVEADLSRQVVALVDGDRLVRAYPTSSGKPSTPTIRGTFRFYSKTPGTNSEGMVDANYFQGGYAVHGYHSVPSYNASHGCLRIPIPNARAVYDWVRLGDRIVVEP